MKKNQHLILLGIAGTLASPPGLAAQVLDQSNTLPDGEPYLEVDPKPSPGVPGAWSINVTTLQALGPMADGHSGIQAFGFDILPAKAVDANDDGASNFDPEAIQLMGLPDSWRWQTGKEFGEFGRFNIKVFSTGSRRTDTLNFMIGGLGENGIGDRFAAFVAGLGDPDSAADGGFFSNVGAGDIEPPASVVLIPAAPWLFISGIMGLGMVARKSHGGERRPFTYIA